MRVDRVLHYLFYRQSRVEYVTRVQKIKKKSMEHETRREHSSLGSRIACLLLFSRRTNVFFLYSTNSVARDARCLGSPNEVFLNRDVSIGPTWRLGKLTSSMRKIRSATVARAIASITCSRDVLCDIKYKYFVYMSVDWTKKYAVSRKTVFAR